MHVFPQGLDNSLLVAVFAGVLVRFFFTETLGWVFSGLVVPGYLAAVLSVRPSAAAVILAEALVTFALVRGVSWLLGASRLGTPVFGRERFVWLVVCSVAVRLVFEALLAPVVSGWALAAQWDPTDGFGFYGIGLVLVPLMANALWKPGLRAGAAQLTVVTLLSFWLIKLVATGTNYSISRLALSFEGVALDFAASPKAYLLLLGGLVLAARASLRFGWDTSGVLIPGLLTLGAFSPLRLVGALAEALLLAALAGLAVRLPGLRRWNIEGPRRVIFVFTLGFLVKFIGCWVAQALSWHLDEGTWGLGYLLPSLLATRMWQRKDSFVVLLPALVLPAAAFAMASTLGFGLKQLPEPDVDVSTAADQPPAACAEDTRWSSWALRASLLTPAPAGRGAPYVREGDVRRFGALLESLKRRAGRPCAAMLDERRQAAVLGLRVDRALDASGGAWSVVSEVGDDPARVRGFGVVLIADAAQPGRLVLGALELAPEWGWPERLEPLALGARAQAVVLLAHARGRTSPPELWRTAVSALGGAGLLVREGAPSRLGSLAPPWLRNQLEPLLGPLEKGTQEQGADLLTLDPAALARLNPARPPSPPVDLWSERAPPPRGALIDDALSGVALRRWLSAPDAVSALADALALGTAALRDTHGRWLFSASGDEAALAQFDPHQQPGLVEVGASDRRLIALGETLRRRLGLQWLLVAPAAAGPSPFARAVREEGLVNGGWVLTVRSAKGKPVLSCIEPAGREDECAAVERLAAQAGVVATREPAFSPAAPQAPSRASAIARSTGAVEVGLWVSAEALPGPSLLTAPELALFQRAGFTERRVSIEEALLAHCPREEGRQALDWRPLELFRQTHQASQLEQLRAGLARSGCAPELWVDHSEGLAFAACAGPHSVSLETLGEGRGRATARCLTDELGIALDQRPAHLEVQP